MFFTVSDLASITSHIHSWVLFFFGSVSSFFLELFLHWPPVAYWAPTNLGSSYFSILPFCFFILFLGFSRQEYWSGLPFPSPVDHILSECGPLFSCNLKNDRMISVCFQGKPFNVTEIQVYPPTSNAEEAEVEWFYEDPQDLLELTPKKSCPFHYRGLECESRKSRNTWSNRQIWPWNTEWSRTKANRVFPREGTGRSKHHLPTSQEKTLHMHITRWSTPKSDWLYSLQPKMEKPYTVSKTKTGSWLWIRSWTPYCQI